MFVLTWEFVQEIFLAAGGLGLFLYGMVIMSDGLESMAGESLRVILERATANRFFGIIVGAVVTCIIQSSSATTVMVVGFVNASMMTLTQAISVIMGAKIGTTITAQIISFQIDPIAPLCIFVGLVMHLFFKKRNLKKFGYILLGFGILFFGISTMGAPLKEFSTHPGFQRMLVNFQNPVLALLAGTLFTAVIQSSSATTGIIVALYLSGVDLPFRTAAFLVLGSNIGTCATALLAALAAKRESKRAALAHILISIVGCTFFGTLIVIFPGILTWIQSTWQEGARQIAMFHTLYNVSAVVLMAPFIKQIEYVVHKAIPELPSEIENTKKLLYLDASIMQMPVLAVSQAKRELVRMGRLAIGNLELALEAFYEVNLEKAAVVKEVEQTVNFLNRQITTWLVRIKGLTLSEKDIDDLGSMMHTVSDIERIGDHAENIADYTLLQETHEAKISPPAIEELRALSGLAVQTVTRALDIFETGDKSRLDQVDDMEDQVDAMSKQCVENHIRRLQEEICDPRGGVVFTDMVIDLERCADHANNIAYAVMGSQIWSIGRHDLQKEFRAYIK